MLNRIEVKETKKVYVEDSEIDRITIERLYKLIDTRGIDGCSAKELFIDNNGYLCGYVNYGHKDDKEEFREASPHDIMILTTIDLIKSESKREPY